jgi:catechol 2,3-dioxygenase-like lactoylglutathione lyase family enzyme
MAEWEKRIFAVNLVVGDLERSKRFYKDVFDLDPLDEEDDLLIYRFTDIFAALRLDPSHESAPPAEVLRLAETGSGQFSIVVPDVDAVHAELEEQGVTAISGPADRYWGMRTFTFADPDGYTWGIAQDLDELR